MNTRRLLALTLIVGLLASTAAAAPLAGPCVPGAAYDPACDANQDGHITITDIQLAADHLIGPLHGGWGVGMSVLTNERGHIGTAVVGLERRLEAMARMADGKELHPVERQRLATLLTTGQAYKAMAQRQGPQAGAAASLMKLGITEMMFTSSMLRGDLSGADAMLEGPESFAMRRGLDNSLVPDQR